MNELSESFATAPHLDFAGPIDLAVSGALADDVLAVVREGLTNAVKHASASAASVVIGVEDGLVTVEVVDDGTGIAKPGKTQRPRPISRLGPRPVAVHSGSSRRRAEPA
ncbi:MAG: ATP-binding protein [Galbitalea sp.]